jgi:hypothetical protein
MKDVAAMLKYNRRVRAQGLPDGDDVGGFLIDASIKEEESSIRYDLAFSGRDELKAHRRGMPGKDEWADDDEAAALSFDVHPGFVESPVQAADTAWASHRKVGLFSASQNPMSSELAALAREFEQAVINQREEVDRLYSPVGERQVETEGNCLVPRKDELHDGVSVTDELFHVNDIDLIRPSHSILPEVPPVSAEVEAFLAQDHANEEATNLDGSEGVTSASRLRSDFVHGSRGSAPPQDTNELVQRGAPVSVSLVAAGSSVNPNPRFPPCAHCMKMAKSNLLRSDSVDYAKRGLQSIPVGLSEKYCSTCHAPFCPKCCTKVHQTISPQGAAKLHNVFDLSARRSSTCPVDDAMHRVKTSSGTQTDTRELESDSSGCCQVM